MKSELLDSPAIHIRWRRYLCLAAVLMGLTFVLLQRLSLSSSPVSPKTIQLRTFPLQIGPWQGVESNLAPEIVTVLKLDEWLQRQYRRDDDTFVWLYVGFYREHPNYHSPIDCYPANGWAMDENDFQQIRIPGLATIRAHKLVVEKGSQKRLVLYWYQWGQVTFTRTALREYEIKISSLLSLLQGKALRRDKALVRISAPVVGSLEETLAREIAFIQTAYPLLVERFAPGVAS